MLLAAENGFFKERETETKHFPQDIYCAKTMWGRELFPQCFCFTYRDAPWESRHNSSENKAQCIKICCFRMIVGIAVPTINKLKHPFQCNLQKLPTPCFLHWKRWPSKLGSVHPKINVGISKWATSFNTFMRDAPLIKKEQDHLALSSSTTSLCYL